MKTFEITEEQVNAALSAAKSDEVKTVLNALFGKEEKQTPTLDDYKTIRTYEDACVALGEKPYLNGELCIGKVIPETYETHAYVQRVKDIPAHIMALMKLETASRALWGRNFQPMPQAEGRKMYWHVWFILWPEKEIEDMKPEKRGTLLSATATYGESVGFGSLDASNRPSSEIARSGLRLCQETKEKAIYFSQQFIELWAEYLKFNFEVGERLKP